MATYNVTLYKNTGFNSINIPDSPTLLAGMSSISVPALDINQERFLPNVRLRASWDDVKDADYAKVGDFFYTINDIQVTSGDVADISLTPDFVTSAGGPAALEILDGLTSRVHVANDTYGIYGEDDPYMAPAYDMDIDSMSHDLAPTGNQRTFVETTLALDSMGSNLRDKTIDAIVGKVDPTNPDSASVVVPIADYLQATTRYYSTIGGSTKQLRSIGRQGIYEISGSAATDYVSDGIDLARSLGIEQSISGQYSIPSSLITVTPLGEFITDIVGKTDDIPALGVPYIYGTANNNRIFYGSYTPYTLVSSAGDTLKANAEEIYDSTHTVPMVRYLVDPRRTGKPYFRFTPLHGNSQAYDFFRDCVAGHEWESVPLVMTERSGGLLDRANYAASQAHHRLDDKWENIGVASAQLSNITSAISGFADAAVAAATGSGHGGSGMFGSLVSGAHNALNIQLAHNQYVERAELDRQIEKAQFQIQQYVNVPTVNFPMNPDLMGELLHNGFMVFRTIYKAADIARIDKILTAFGYKHTKVLETSDFTNRQYFNYVQGSISVANLPHWWSAGIAAQINSGVRVWHVKPSHTYYTNNPIRVTP